MCDKLLLTVIEAAEMLGIHRSRTYQFIQRGELKSLKIGGARRVLITDLHEFVRTLKEAAGDGDGV